MKEKTTQYFNYIVVTEIIDFERLEGDCCVALMKTISLVNLKIFIWKTFAGHQTPYEQT